MYDQFLSPRWVFDRCMEASGNWQITAIFPFIFIFIWTVVIKLLRNSKMEPALKVLIASIPIIPANLALIFMIFTIFNSLSHNYFPAEVLIGVAVILFCDLVWALIMLLNFQKKVFPKKNFIVDVINFLLLSATLAPTVFFSGLFGGLVVCRAQNMLTPLTSAHPIHAIIKERFAANENIPKDLSDLREINPREFETMTTTGKVNYAYNKENNTYALFVRPSLHYVALFDSIGDYQIYKLDNMKLHFDPAPSWPPKHDGPWDKLPK